MNDKRLSSRTIINNIIGWELELKSGIDNLKNLIYDTELEDIAPNYRDRLVLLAESLIARITNELETYYEEKSYVYTYIHIYIHYIYIYICHIVWNS